MVAVAKTRIKQNNKKRDRKKGGPLKKADEYVDLVKRVAYNMARRLPSRVDVRDLIGAGTIGLLVAWICPSPTTWPCSGTWPRAWT